MRHILPMNDTKNKQTYSKEIYNWLWNYSLHYLARYEVSVSKLKYKLIDRKEKFPYPLEAGEYHAAIEAVIEKLTVANLLSDERYASARFHQLMSRGKSLNYIRQDLKHAGLNTDIIEEIIEEKQKEASVDCDEMAAVAYMKKRRLGAFLTKNIERDALFKTKQKEIAALARQGFSYDLITRLLAKDKEELETLHIL